MLIEMDDEYIRNYSGKNPYVAEKEVCEQCQKEMGNSHSGRCSGCRLVRYCSRDCQKEHYKTHKKMCNGIKRATEKVEKEAVLLRSFQDPLFGFGRDGPENLFETHPGRFWGILETRDYMRARMDLIKKILEFVSSKRSERMESKAGLKQVCDHYQELLRLCRGDNLGTRFLFPAALLRLDRDDDAYAFCRYWIKEADDDAADELHANSKEGDWLYGREPNCRFNDILKEVDHSGLKYTGLAILMGLLIVKMRVVAVLEAQKLREGADFMLDDKLAEQKAHRDGLLDLVHQSNETMLPALLHPAPLLSQGLPPYYSPGKPSEAGMLLEDTLHLWDCIPGAKEILKERFGTDTPSYSLELAPSTMM